MYRFAAFVAAGATAAIAAPACAQDGAQWEQSPMVMLPGLAEAGDGVVEEGSVLFRLPFHWFASTRLTQDVVIQAGNDELVLEAGTQLPALLAGQGEKMEDRRTGYCTRSRIGVSGDPGNGGLLGGLLGGGLGTRLAESLMDAQTCLEDTDKDGYFDRAFAVGRGDNDMVDYGEIDPVPFTAETFAAVDGDEDFLEVVLQQTRDDYADFEVKMMVQGRRISFDRMSATPFSVTSSVRVFLEGEEPEFNSQDWLLRPQRLPRHSILGMQVAVESTDRREDQAHVKWEPEVSETVPVVVPQQMSVSYRYY